MKARRICAAMAAMTMAVACGKQAPPVARQSRPTDVILRVLTAGGFVPREFALTNMPSFSLMGDGRVIVEGPQDASYPGPALPNVRQRQLTEAGVQALIDEAKRAGLDGPDHSYAAKNVADAGTTTFTFTEAGRSHVIAVEALGIPEAGGDQDVRDRLQAFNEKLSGLDSWLPKGSVGPDQPYEMSALRLFSEPYDPKQFSDTAVKSVKDWPLATPAATFGTPFEAPARRCGVVQGADLTEVLNAMKEANQATAWRSDGKEYRLLARPLLPDESACPAD